MWKLTQLCHNSQKGWLSYCSFWVKVGYLESQFNGMFWWFADNWWPWKDCSGIRLSKMFYDVKDFWAFWTSFRCWMSGLWTRNLYVLFIIIHSVIVNGIEGLKTYDSFKAIFQSKSFECLNSMDFVWVCKNLLTKTSIEIKREGLKE